MPQAGTPPGLPGRKGIFGCWCKWTSGLGMPRLRSHFSTVFVLPYCPNWLPRSLIYIKYGIQMGNGVLIDTHIYLVGISVMTCRGISEMGTWKPFRHTTWILAGSTIHREGLLDFWPCNVPIDTHVHLYSK